MGPRQVQLCPGRSTRRPGDFTLLSPREAGPRSQLESGRHWAPALGLGMVLLWGSLLSPVVRAVTPSL